MIRRIFYTILLIGLILLIGCNSNEKPIPLAERLHGLILVKDKNFILENRIPLDGNTIPFYNAEGERLDREEIKNLTNSGKYKIHGYIDSNKVIKAIVLRKAFVKQL
jgi:hypothetical protein